MNNIWGLLGAIAGMFVGILLYQLPARLFYRDTTWLTEEEFLKAFPQKWWVTRAMYALLPLGFALFAVLMGSTADINRGINWFFFFPIFFSCLGALPALPELLAQASVQIPIGHGARTPVLYLFSPNAFWAGWLRLTTASVVVAAFLWCR